MNVNNGLIKEYMMGFDYKINDMSFILKYGYMDSFSENTFSSPIIIIEFQNRNKIFLHK